MSQHLDVVKRAIEFRKPDYLPMEIIDVPGIYNAYHTLDPDTVKLVPGAENFDSLWPCCYSWFHEIVGKTDEGEVLRQDQFGVKLKTPKEMNSTYALVAHPLAGKTSLEGYEFPDPDDSDPHYEKLGQVIRERYSDRFVNGYIDAGIFLTTELLFGIQEFLLRCAEDVNFVVGVYGRVMDYYLGLLPKFKKAGAHMITVIEDIGGPHSLVIRPDMWREHFKPLTKRFFQRIHDLGMYTGILIDGNSREVLEDLPDMDVDVFSTVDIRTTGIDVVREKLKGKMCLKVSVDMQTTLPRGTPEAVEREVDELVESLGSPDGGLMCYVLRWHRPEFPSANVLASARAFNKYRKGSP